MFDTFGTAVAIDGKYIISGAIYEDHNVTGTDSVADAGSVYIFETPSLLKNLKITSSNNIQVYPNPFESELKVSCDFKGSVKVSIRSTTGQLVDEQTVNDCSKINFPNTVKSGFYVLQVTSNNITYTQKVQKL